MLDHATDAPATPVQKLRRLFGGVAPNVNGTLSKSTRQKYYVILAICAVVLAISIYIVSVSITRYEYFDQTSILIKLTMSGLVLGAIVAFGLKQLAPTFSAFRWQGGTMGATLAVMTLMSTYGYGLALNRINTRSYVQSFRITYIGYSNTYTRRNGRSMQDLNWYMDVLGAPGAVRCRFGKTFTSLHNIGDEIHLTVHEGLWGIDFVTLDDHLQ